LIIGDRIPDRIRTIVVQVIGLVTLGLGLSDVLKTHNMVFPLVGMVLGGIVGELLAIERRLEGLGEAIRRRFARNQEPGKTLDGFMNVIFGAIYGIGAVFSALSIFVVQGSLTLGGSALDNLLNDRMRIELFSAGGFAVMAIGLNLLEIKKIRLGSLLPGLVITPLLVWLFAVPTGVIGQSPCAVVSPVSHPLQILPRPLVPLLHKWKYSRVTTLPQHGAFMW